MTHRLFNSNPAEARWAYCIGYSVVYSPPGPIWWSELILLPYFDGLTGGSQFQEGMTFLPGGCQVIA